MKDGIDLGALGDTLKGFPVDAGGGVLQQRFHDAVFAFFDQRAGHLLADVRTAGHRHHVILRLLLDDLKNVGLGQ